MCCTLFSLKTSFDADKAKHFERTNCYNVVIINFLLVFSSFLYRAKRRRRRSCTFPFRILCCQRHKSTLILYWSSVFIYFTLESSFQFGKCGKLSALILRSILLTQKTFFRHNCYHHWLLNPLRLQALTFPTSNYDRCNSTILTKAFIVLNFLSF